MIHADTPFITHLKTLPPSAADLEIRSLNPLSGSSNELTTFVEALTQRLTQRLDYELVQAWMNVFLKHHGDVVGSDEELRGSLKLWKDAQEREAWRVGELVGYLSGVVGFLRNPRT
jgi:U3 small nucleolar RNA-associated protein 21